MKFQALPGVFDILPEDPKNPWKSSFLWQYVEEKARILSKNFEFEEIRTPLFERTELFARSVGEETDIVSKEMYTFEDRGQRSLTLRPEGTAPVIRAFLEKGLQHSLPKKYYYISSMFRYERAQKGRYRQHHQFGAEAFGIKSPAQDAEIIHLACSLYQTLGLKNLNVSLNCLGDTSVRETYHKELVTYFSDIQDSLSQESQTRLKVNPLRILDSKQQEDINALKKAPSILDFLDKDSLDYFNEVQYYLSNLDIAYSVNPKLVRGLDYYTGTVFEIITEDLGAQSSLGGGGRYDHLIQKLGGPDIPAVGFGTGLERILQTMLTQNVSLPEPSTPLVALIPLGDQAFSKCFILASQLRTQGFAIHMDFRKRSLNKAMQQADQMNARYALVLGERELETKQVDIKDLSTGQKTAIHLDNIIPFLTKAS